MNLLFEINHPAQAHLFKHVISQLNTNGHRTTVLIKESKVLQDILNEVDIPFIILGKKGSSLSSKAIRQLTFIARMYKLHLRNHFDLGIGVSVSIPLLSRISSLPSIVLDDDDKKATPYFAFLAHKNASVLLRPDSLNQEGKHYNTIYYKGFHELAYLHPSTFRPDITVLEEQGLKSGESFFILRLVALKAHHDKGIKGISKEQADEIVSLLKNHGRIIITSESQDNKPKGTESLRINPARLHHLMAFAKMVISDGQTMCSESSCLGIPSIRINDFVGRISCLEDQEKKWQLTFGFKPAEFTEALEKMEVLLSEDASIFKNRRDGMIAASINVKDFLVWFIEKYPESKRIMKENSDYQYKFR